MKSPDRQTPKREPTIVEVHDPATLKGNLKPIGGSMSDDWNNIIANQTVQALWVKNSDEGEIKHARRALLPNWQVTETPSGRKESQ